MAEPLGDGDRIGERQRIPNGFSFAKRRHSLAVTEMRVHIHEADLAPEERGRLGPTKDHFRSTVVGHWPVHPPHTVGEEGVIADYCEDGAGLARA